MPTKKDVKPKKEYFLTERGNRNYRGYVIPSYAPILVKKKGKFIIDLS